MRPRGAARGGPRLGTEGEYARRRRRDPEPGGQAAGDREDETDRECGRQRRRDGIGGLRVALAQGALERRPVEHRDERHDRHAGQRRDERRPVVAAVPDALDLEGVDALREGLVLAQIEVAVGHEGPGREHGPERVGLEPDRAGPVHEEGHRDDGERQQGTGRPPTCGRRRARAGPRPGPGQRRCRRGRRPAVARGACSVRGYSCAVRHPTWGPRHPSPPTSARPTEILDGPRQLEQASPGVVDAGVTASVVDRHEALDQAGPDLAGHGTPARVAPSSTALWPRSSSSVRCCGPGGSSGTASRSTRRSPRWRHAGRSARCSRSCATTTRTRRSTT